MVIIWLLYGYYMVIIWLLYGYYMVNNNLVGGWPSPLKNDGVKVSRDYCTSPNVWKNQIQVPNHQPENM